MHALTHTRVCTHARKHVCTHSHTHKVRVFLHILLLLYLPTNFAKQYVNITIKANYNSEFVAVWTKSPKGIKKCNAWCHTNISKTWQLTNRKYGNINVTQCKTKSVFLSCAKQKWHWHHFNHNKEWVLMMQVNILCGPQFQWMSVTIRCKVTGNILRDSWLKNTYELLLTMPGGHQWWVIVGEHTFIFQCFDVRNLWQQKQVLYSKFEGFWQWCFTTYKTVLLNFVHHLNYKITVFQKLDSASGML
jgi:hypothetical protein